jgi:ankyrin repeat protein
MVSNGADIDTDYSTKVSVAQSSDDRRYEIACTPLQAACVKGHLDIANFLVECNADLSGSVLHGVTPLHFACHQVKF